MEYKNNPPWRKRFQSPRTEEMLEEVNKFRFGEVSSRRAADEALVNFVGVVRWTGQWLLCDDRHGKDLVEYHLQTYNEDFSAEAKAEVRALMDAVTYAEEHMSNTRIKLHQLFEVHRRVMGDKFKGGNVMRTHCSDTTGLIKGILPAVNAALGDINEDEGDALPRIKAAAMFCTRFKQMKPFEDGNARVCEVVMAVILRGLAPFPFQTFSSDPDISYHGRIRKQLRGGSGGDFHMPLVVSYIIERALGHQRQALSHAAALRQEQQEALKKD